jgi:HAD superfamily hydrolase (TIGR01509 family)
MSQLQAVIFGAIGVIAETSDLQRQAFNAAFDQAGLGWNWDADTYRKLLTINGGQARLRTYRDADISRSEVSNTVIAAVHDRKTAHYEVLVNQGALTPRPGVVKLLAECKAAGIRTALCTSTSQDNVSALATALGQHIDFKAFASITTIDKIAAVKPAPDAYLHCLAALGLTAHGVIAIEDTPVSMASAIAAGISVVATPGAMTGDQDFSGAALVVPDLTSVRVEVIEALLAAVS